MSADTITAKWNEITARLKLSRTLTCKLRLCWHNGGGRNQAKKAMEVLFRSYYDSCKMHTAS